MGSSRRISYPLKRETEVGAKLREERSGKLKRGDNI